LLRNKGDGTFEDVSARVGLDKAFGPGLGVVTGEWNGDSQVDFYVANDGEENQLWLSKPDGTYADKALVQGCALSGDGTPEAGMGLVHGDLDRDGRWDFFVTHLNGQTHTFYAGRKRGYRDATSRTGSATNTRAATGFGVGWADFDHNGFEDLYIASGRVSRLSPRYSETKILAEPDQVLPGIAAGKFGAPLENSGTKDQILEVGRGAAFGDMDGDGDIDVVINNNGGPLRMLRNVSVKQGQAAVLSVEQANGIAALGAEVRVRIGDQTRLFQVQAASSFCASNGTDVHVGLGQAKQIDSVSVKFPDGTTQEFPAVPAGQRVRLQRKP